MLLCFRWEDLHLISVLCVIDYNKVLQNRWHFIFSSHYPVNKLIMYHEVSNSRKTWTMVKGLASLRTWMLCDQTGPTVALHNCILFLRWNLYLLASFILFRRSDFQLRRILKIILRYEVLKRTSMFWFLVWWSSVFLGKVRKRLVKIYFCLFRKIFWKYFELLSNKLSRTVEN
jgi:hypothetical protein